MNAKDIVSKEFDTVKRGGYDAAEVDTYLKDVSIEYKKMQNENEELEKKLEVLAEKIIQEGERSKSFLMVVPIQDWLGMGKEARINTPGTSSGNWQWRLRSMDLLKSLAPRIKKTIGDRAQ